MSRKKLDEIVNGRIRPVNRSSGGSCSSQAAEARYIPTKPARSPQRRPPTWRGVGAPPWVYAQINTGLAARGPGHGDVARGVLAVVAGLVADPPAFG